MVQLGTLKTGQHFIYDGTNYIVTDVWKLHDNKKTVCVALLTGNYRQFDNETFVQPVKIDFFQY